ncbi:MAG: Wzz/FepE/Etk N-terminal domain-containing protein [Acetobacteraceae bacterium]
MYQLQVLIRKQLSAAWRYRWPAIAFSWLVCAGGWLYVLNIPNVYEASARMYVDADAVLTPLLRGLAVDTSLGAQVDLLQRTLLSRPNLEKLISKTDLELQTMGASDKSAMAERLASEIHFSPQTRNLFVISYRNQQPKLAYDVVQAMLTAFVESKAGTNRADLENASRFIETQLSLYERQLRDAEHRRAAFYVKYMEVLPQDGGVSRLEGAAGMVKSLQGQLTDALQRKSALERELASTQPLLVVESENSPAVRVQAAERQLQELRLRSTEAHPDVIAQKRLIEALKRGDLGPEPGAARASSAGTSRSVPNPVFEQLKVRLVETVASIASLQRQLVETTEERDRLETVARGAPGLQADAININRDYQLLTRNYTELASRREAMRMSAAAEASADNVKIQVIDPPLVPQRPIAPKRVVLTTGVLLAGLGAGLGLALLLVQLDQSFHTTDDLHSFGYPVVGGVSMLAAAVPFVRRAVTIGSFAIAAAIPCIIYGGLVLTLLRAGNTA